MSQRFNSTVVPSTIHARENSERKKFFICFSYFFPLKKTGKYWRLQYFRILNESSNSWEKLFRIMDESSNSWEQYFSIINESCLEQYFRIMKESSIAGNSILESLMSHLIVWNSTLKSWKNHLIAGNSILFRIMNLI